MMSSTLSLFLSHCRNRYGYNVYREENREKRGEREMEGEREEEKRSEEMGRAQNSTRRKQMRQNIKQLILVKVMDLGKGYNFIILENFP